MTLCSRVHGHKARYRVSLVCESEFGQLLLSDGAVVDADVVAARRRGLDVEHDVLQRLAVGLVDVADADDGDVDGGVEELLPDRLQDACNS